MEIIFWGLVVCLWWITSITVLLPLTFLIKYNKFAGNLWFSLMYTKLMDCFVERTFTPVRRKAFELLKEDLSQRNVTKPLKVLEIGVGPGQNLQFYPDNSHLTTLDMNATFESYFRQNQKKYPHIMYEGTVVSMAENMKDIEDSSFDVVVATYVLCSVARPKDALKEIKRVLKPGGKYLFVEHVSYPKSQWGFIIQKFTDPVWNIYFNGCHMQRSSEDAIKNATFSDVVCNRVFPQSIIVFVRPQIYGLATK